MQGELHETELSRRSSRRLLVIINIAVGLIILLFVYGAFLYYDDSIEEATASEGRFIMTEWQLLRELKLDTDRQLLEKDREISELRQRYLQLSQREPAGSALEDLEQQLMIAEQEREAILQQRIDVPAAIPPERDRSTDEPAGIRTEIPRLQLVRDSELNSFTRLLQTRIDTLQAQLDESQLYAEILEDDVRRSLAQISSLEGVIRNVSELRERISLRTEPIAPESLSDAQEESDLDLLETRLLVKALVRQPQFLREYPDLPERLDSYFTFLEESGRAEGQEEGYTEAMHELLIEIDSLLQNN
ncbi:hypothetical protein [Spirochaeta dissipatitropha]